MNASIPEVWLEKLKLDQRTYPDFITNVDQVEPGPYAGPIRTCLTDLSLNGIFCIGNIPTIAIFVLDDDKNHYEPVNSIHKALWNQGIASFLGVIQSDVFRLYSLNTRPEKHDTPDFDDECDSRLLDILTLSKQALEIGDLISGIESGRLSKEYSSAFEEGGRIDSVLLRNLQSARLKMVNLGVPPEAAANLLMQTMFLAYLRDRKIIDKDYLSRLPADLNINSIEDIFKQPQAEAFNQLITLLNQDFNGGLFFQNSSYRWDFVREPLLDFMMGHVDMESGQYYLYSYDFKYIPIELISEVYDVFLGADIEQKKTAGAYYTPRFLAQIIVDQVWDYVVPTIENNTDIPTLDPACGSGVFLVAMFHRLIENWRFENQGEKPTWAVLTKIAHCLHGRDKNPTAILIAAFSLSIALLEQVSPPQIHRLKSQGKFLPVLIGHSLKAGDFFKFSTNNKYRLVIGNPPWGKNKGQKSTGEQWCDIKSLSYPNREMAWPFVWKSIQHVTSDGVIGFLLPITSLLLNSRASVTVQAWIKNCKITKLINLADMRYLLFRNAKHSAIVAVYTKAEIDQSYNIQLWSPKSDLNLISSRRLLLSPQDKTDIPSEALSKDPTRAVKLSMWGGNRSIKLFNYLMRLSKVSDRIVPHKKAMGQGQNREWIYGRGFQPVTEDSVSEKYREKELNLLSTLPYITAKEVNCLAIPEKWDSTSYPTTKVLFKGHVDGYYGPHILFPEGANGLRVKAAYSEQNLSFNKSVNVISVPKDKKNDGKLLTAILCSSLSSWFMLQSSQVWIARPRIQGDDILSLPFPDAKDLPDPRKARTAYGKIVDFIDSFKNELSSYYNCKKILKFQQTNEFLNRKLTTIDTLVFDYFNLLDHERAIITESMEYVIKSIQPNRIKFPPLLKPSDSIHWEQYCKILESELATWIDSASGISASIVGVSKDLAVVRISLRNLDVKRVAKSSDQISNILDSIYENLPVPQTRNIYILRSLMVFLDDDLYLVKPRQIRFWLSQTAMEDADTIAADLFEYSVLSTDSA